MTRPNYPPNYRRVLKTAGHLWLVLLVLSVPACRSFTSGKSKKPKATAAVVKPLPIVVLIPPELVGQRCVVQIGKDDEPTFQRFTGTLLKFNDEVLELETPEAETKLTRDKQILGKTLFSSTALGREQSDENKSLSRSEITSIRAVSPASE